MARESKTLRQFVTTGLRLSADIAKKGKRPRLPKPRYLALNRNVQNAKSGLWSDRERHGYLTLHV